jgi:hypothetical protein
MIQFSKISRDREVPSIWSHGHDPRPGYWRDLLEMFRSLPKAAASVAPITRHGPAICHRPLNRGKAKCMIVRG